MQDVAVTYQGRKTSRVSSEQRRLAILQAALRVVVRDGVRGVRHRAVAAEAGVPLSATTYYFKDIHDLITDAFILYAKETMEHFVDPFWAKANESLRQYAGQDMASPEVRRQMVAVLAGMGADYILNQLEHHREQLHIEYAFLYAALLDERLHGLTQQYGQRLLANLCDMFVFLNGKTDGQITREVELAAKSMLGLIRRLEYEALVGRSGAMDRSEIELALRHQMLCMMGICPDD